MAPEPTVPRDSTAIIDTSVLIAMGGPDNDRYRAFEQFVTRHNLTVYIPGYVAEELGESPDPYAYQRDRLRAAQDAGWLKPGQIDFSTPGVSKIVDKTRKRMLNLSAEDVTEDEIEKTDTVLAGLAYQFAVAGAVHVTVFVSDAKAEQAIEDVLNAVDVGGTVTIIEGRDFITALVDQQFG